MFLIIRGYFKPFWPNIKTFNIRRYEFPRKIEFVKLDQILTLLILGDIHGKKPFKMSLKFNITVVKQQNN